jgi:peptidoglycan/xylan/chitin deacetylase (PgdA/CDA1 family)
VRADEDSDQMEPTPGSIVESEHVEPHGTLHGSREHKRIALTFDDGPAERTVAVLNALADYGARATFFICGRNVTGREPILRRIVDEGHEVGNHSFQHAMFPGPADLGATSALIRSITGQAPRSFRPPFGALNARTVEAVRQIGMTSILWDVDSEDVFPVWQGKPADELYRTVTSRVQHGSIVLMHDGLEWSHAPEATPAIVADLVSRGFELVTVSELLDEPSDTRLGRARDRLRRVYRRDGKPDGGRHLALARSWDSPPPPLSEHEIEAMKPGQIARYLERREPSDRSGDASPEGMSRLLVDRVVAHPSAFARLADRLAAVDPIYLRAILTGIQKAVAVERSLDWETVLDVIEAAVRGRPGPGAGPESEQEWRRTCMAALAGLGAGLRQNVVPFSLRERVWSTIEELSWTSDGPQAAVDGPDPNGMLRSQAVSTAVPYAAWVRANSELEPAIAQIPEVDRCLEAHLDPARERSPAVRSVYGTRLLQLHTIDPAWVEAHVDAVFPDAQELAPLREAAWDAYLPWARPTPEILATLEDRYLLAVSELPLPASRRKPADNDPPLSLARHLATLYLIDALDVAEDGIVHRFVSRAAPRELTYFVTLTGSALERVDLERTDDARPRLSLLWDRIVEWTADRDHDELVQALAPFGLWYAAGQFEPQWADGHLADLLRRRIAVWPEFRALARVAGRAAEDPAAAVEIVGLYVDLLDDRWRAYSVRDSLRAAIDLGLVSPDPTVQERAREVERSLEAKGFARFDDLVAAP